MAALLLAACGDDDTGSGDGSDSGSATADTGTTNATGTSSAPGTSSGSGSTGATGATTSDPGGWPECEPDGGIDDSVQWIGVENIENDSMYDQYGDHDCTVTAVAETSVDFDCVGRDIAMVPSTPRVEVATSSPVTLPFSVDQVVRLRSRGYLGVITWYVVSDDAGELLLATTREASPMNPGEADWYTPLMVGEDEDVCPEGETEKRTAVTASLAGESIVVLGGNEASIGNGPSYLVRVTDAYVVLEDVIGGCQRCITSLFVAQP
jgi:hypothetical protein